jgi:hypothetical protein
VYVRNGSASVQLNFFTERHDVDEI